MTFAAADLGDTVITVSNSAELKAAYILLAGQDGGGTIEMVEGHIYDIAFKDLDAGKNPVVIASADADNPTQVERIHLESVENVRIENVYVDSTQVTDRAVWRDDLLVKDSASVQIVNSEFVHDANGLLTSDAGKVESVGIFRESTDVEFSGNSIEGYYHGVGFSNTEGIIVDGNDISKLQGDGLRFGVVENVEITDNYIHDFYGSLNDVNHSDMIQFWGTTAGVTKNVTISGNTLISGDVASQSIFIRNEQFGRDNDGGGYHENFKITDNVIYNGNPHGISVSDVDGVLVADNTVLWNQEAMNLWLGKTPETAGPRILVNKSINADVFDNIGFLFGENESTTSDGNVVLDYTDPEADNYAGKHVADPFGATELSDLWILPSSPFAGAGAAGTKFPSEIDGVVGVVTHEINPSDIYEFTFDASQSLADAGLATDGDYTFEWAFSDGTQVSGPQATMTFSGEGEHKAVLTILKDGVAVDTVEHDFTVVTKDLLDIDFENGITDGSENDALIYTQGNGAGVAGETGLGHHVGDFSKLKVDADTVNIQGLDRFGLSLDMKLDNVGDEGIFIHQAEGFEGEILDDGRVTFSLTTDDGTFRMTSDQSVFSDNGWHNIGIGYDSASGKMQMFADGELVADAAATGSTDSSNSGISFGHPFKELDSITATLDNIVMSRDHGIAGTDSNPTTDPAPADPEVDVVPVEDPEEPDPVVADPIEPVAPVDPIVSEPVADDPIDVPDGYSVTKIGCFGWLDAISGKNDAAPSEPQGDLGGGFFDRFLGFGKIKPETEVKDLTASDVAGPQVGALSVQAKIGANEYDGGLSELVPTIAPNWEDHDDSQFEEDYTEPSLFLI